MLWLMMGSPEVRRIRVNTATQVGVMLGTHAALARAGSASGEPVATNAASQPPAALVAAR